MSQPLQQAEEAEEAEELDVDYPIGICICSALWPTKSSASLFNRWIPRRSSGIPIIVVSDWV